MFVPYMYVQCTHRRRKYSGVYEYCILCKFLLRPFLTLCLRENSQNTVHIWLIFFLILEIAINIFIFIQWSNILEQIVRKPTSLPPSKLVLLVNKQSLCWSGRLELTKSVRNDSHISSLLVMDPKFKIIDTVMFANFCKHYKVSERENETWWR